MHFDWTVNVGQVIVAVGLLTGFVSAHIQNIKKLQDIETKLHLIYTWWTNHINKER